MTRADEILVKSGIVESRSKACALIREGKVAFNGKIVDKASRKFDEKSARIEIVEGSAAARYVSRAGLKLEAALEAFEISLIGMNVLDAGASTGGFTDCMLSRGAESATCVDVGTGQLHKKLLEDSRVRNLEKTDIRNLSPDFFNGKLFDFACADLSFISLEKVLPHIIRLVKPRSKIVCLVKPQFEVGPELARKCGGVVKDESARRAALEKVKQFALSCSPSCELIGSIQSPISGGDGNVEFLICLRV